MDVMTYSSLQTYINDVSRYDLLSPEEERSLGYRVMGGDKAAREQFINSNLRLVVGLARSIKNRRGGSLLDLIQEGNKGLMVAVDKFDPDKGKFSTHATWWIKQAMFISLYKDYRVVRLPVGVESLIGKTRKVIDSYLVETGEELPVEKITRRVNRGKKMKYKPRQVRGALEISEERIFSLDALVLEDVPYVDILEARREGKYYELVPFDELDNGSVVDCFRGYAGKHLEVIDSELDNVLTLMEKKILILRKLYDHTLEEVGEKLGISRERVRQIQNKVLEKLRESKVLIELHDLL